MRVAEAQCAGQAGVLQVLKGQQWSWYDCCGWNWGSPTRTQQILDSLVTRGLVVDDTTLVS